MKQCASLKDKMRTAYALSCRLAFTEEGGVHDTGALYGAEASDLIWAWCEGGMHQYLEKRLEGRCSLQAFIDFDPGKFEDMVDRDITAMRALCTTAKGVIAECVVSGIR